MRRNNTLCFGIISIFFLLNINVIKAQCPSALSMSVQITQISPNAELVDFNGTLNDLTLEVAALGPGEIDMTVLVTSVNYDGGSTIQYPHGISFQAGSNWTAAAEIPPPGFDFFDSVTGICTGETYGPGYFYVNNNQSSYNPVTGLCEAGGEISSPPTNDGDPGNNWGVNPNNFPTDFGFNLTYCPVSSAPQNFSETITFVITEDGQSGGWVLGSGCAPVTVTFTIVITDAYTKCSCGEPSPDVSLGNTPPTLCAGDAFDLATLAYVDNSGLGATPVEYYASLPINPANQISSVVNPETTTTYYVLLEEPAAGCTDFIEVTIPVTEPIDVIAPPTACLNEPIILSSTNGVANWYDADPNAGGFTVHTGTSYSPTPTATGTYQYWAVPASGLCNGIATAVSVDVYGNQPIAFDETYCLNDIAQPLTALGDPGASFVWWVGSPTGAGSSVAPVPDTQYEGTYPYYVAQSINGCTSEPLLINVTINPLPTVNILDSQCSADLTTYNLNFEVVGGSGSFSIDGGLYIINDNGGGLYTVQDILVGDAPTITVTDNNCPGSPVVVDDLEPVQCPCPDVPEPTGGADNFYCAGESPTSLNVDPADAEYELIWLNGSDAEVGTGNTFTPSAAGTYYIFAQHTVNNCSSDTLSFTLTQNPAIDTLNVMYNCNPSFTDYNIDLTINGGTGVLNVSAETENAASLTVVDNADGTYTIENIPTGESASIFAQDENDCGRTFVSIAYDCGCPIISPPSANSLAYCVGGAIPAFSLPDPGADFELQWFDVASGGVSIYTGTDFAPNAAGTYYAEIVEIASACTSQRIEMSIVENALPNIDAGNASSIGCGASAQIQLEASTTETGDISFQWTTSDGNIVGSADTEDITIDAAGTYTVTITDNNTCSNSDDVVVTSNAQLPNVSAGNDAVIDCNNTSLNLNATTSDTGNLSFVWTTINGNIVGNFNQQDIEVNAPGTYTVTITNDDNACTNTDEVIITENIATPNANAGTDKVIICGQSSVVLDGSSTTPAVTYSWAGPNIISGDNTATPSVGSAGTYTLTVTNSANGCTQTDQVDVSVDADTPDANAGPDLTLSCELPTLTLQGASSSVGNISYAWVPSNGGNIVSDATTLTPTVNSAGTYTLTVTNEDNNCFATDVVEVSSNTNKPVISAGNDTTLTCVVTQIVLQGSSSAGNMSYLWTATGGGFIVNGNNTLNPTVNTAGTYTLTVTDNDNDCEETASVGVTEDIVSPIANAGDDDTIVCGQNTVTLDGSSSTGNNLAYSWSTTDGSISGSAQLDTVVASAAGIYILTVTNTANGCTATDDATVTADANLPNISIAPPQQLTCTQSSVDLMGSSSTQANLSYTWTTADGNISGNAQQANISVDATGTYTLTISNIDNNCEATADVIVTEDIVSPTAFAGNDGILVCEQSSVSLDGSGSISNTGNSLTYNWTTTDGSISGNAQQVMIDASAAGIYTLTVTDSSNGCFDTDDATVTADANVPNINIAPPQQLTCTQSSVDLMGSSSTQANLSYTWTTADGNISSNAQQANISVDAPGTYTLTILNNDNNCDISSSVIVTEDIVSPVANAGNTAIIDCSSPTIILNGTATNGTNFSYAWTTSNGNILNGANANAAEINAPGNYTLTVTNEENGCIDSDEVVITADENLPIVNAGQNLILCSATDTVSLLGTVTSTGNYTYEWTSSLGQILSGLTSLTPEVVGSGQYTLTVTDSDNGCTNFSSVTITTTPEISFMVTDQICSEDYSTYTAHFALSGGEGAYNIQISDEQANTYTAIDLGNNLYEINLIPSNALLTLNVTDDNNCSQEFTTQFECVVPEEELIYDIWLPTAFSPNGDGINDIYRLVNVGEVAAIYLAVYDRWGNLLFESNALDFGWDGTYKGINSELGVYMYYAKAVFTDGEERIFKGNVTLVR